MRKKSAIVVKYLDIGSTLAAHWHEKRASNLTSEYDGVRD